jgi:hypothetical protein
MITPQTSVKVRRFATHIPCSLIALFIMSVIMSVGSLRTQAQDVHPHSAIQQNQAAITSPQNPQSVLLKLVRDATTRFRDVSEAERAHYALLFGCVSGPDEGAMGLHFVNMDLLDEVNKTGKLDPARPQIVLYEAQPNGTLKLTGADFLVYADAWDANHPGVTPQLMGQIFHYFEAPNRFGLPAFYTLHVWAWKENPKGAFVNWHPNVSCQSFVGQTTP